MVAAVTLSKVSSLEACNTLNYAERAMKMNLQAKKNVLNGNVHMSMYSTLTEEYKEEVQGIQRKCDKAQTENTATEAEVGELNIGLELMTASRNALLRAQETSGGDGGQARCNDALSTTPVPDWRLANTVRRKSATLPSGKLGDSFEGYTATAKLVPASAPAQAQWECGHGRRVCNAHGTILEPNAVERGTLDLRERHSKAASA
ncbi:hypothetical protein HPB49_005944 [Dermacentor silvarum]|uniref:Uncharacterized protein n=1 Tax=Dermacentor silvarum TaxID=543639 RepID=A0ACB8DW85_DERSI|nr:hypothetical protein HPB49_005944 [Dermacentor silvarum]